MAPAADDFGFVPEEAGGAGDFGFTPEGPEAVTISPQVAARDAALRATPRGEPVQIGEPTTAEKVAGYIPEELTATLASYGRSVLPVIYSAAAEKLGLTREEQRRLEREHPLATGAGSVLGIATQIAAVGPLAGAGRVAGATAAETAAAAGASKIAQVGEAMSAALPAAMGAKAALLAPVATPVAALGTAARAGLGALLPAAEGGLGVARAAGIGAAAGALEAGLLGTAADLDRKYVDNEKLTGEAVVQHMISGGKWSAVIDAIAPALGVIGRTAAGKRFATSLGRSNADRVVGRMSGQEAAARAVNTIGADRYRQLINEAIDLGVIAPTMSPDKVLARATEGLKKSGDALKAVADEAAARTTAANAPDLGGVFGNIRKRVVEPLLQKGGTLNEAAAENIEKQLASYEKAFANKPFTASDLWEIRQGFDKIAFAPGIDYAVKDATKQAARASRSILADDLAAAMEATGLPKNVWATPLRQSEMYFNVRDLAKAGVRSSKLRNLTLGQILSRSKDIPIAATVGAVLAAKAGVPYATVAVPAAYRAGRKLAQVTTEAVSAATRRGLEAPEAYAKLAAQKAETEAALALENDPARRAALEGLQEITNNLKKTSLFQVDRLAGPGRATVMQLSKFKAPKSEPDAALEQDIREAIKFIPEDEDIEPQAEQPVEMEGE